MSNVNELCTVIVGGEEYNVRPEEKEFLDGLQSKGLSLLKWKEKLSREEAVMVCQLISKPDEGRDIIQEALDNDETIDWKLLMDAGLVLQFKDWAIAEALYNENFWKDDEYASYQIASAELHDIEFFDRYFKAKKEEGKSWIEAVKDAAIRNEKGEALCYIQSDDYVLRLMQVTEDKREVCRAMVDGMLGVPFSVLYDYIKDLELKSYDDVVLKSRMASLFLNSEGCEKAIVDPDIYGLINVFLELGVDFKYVKIPTKFLLGIIKDKKTLLTDDSYIGQLYGAISGNPDLFTILPIIKEFIELKDFENFLLPQHTQVLGFFMLQGIDVEKRFITMDLPASHEELFASYDKYNNSINLANGTTMSIQEYLEKVGQEVLSSELDELTEFTVDAFIINKFIAKVTEYATTNGFMEEVEVEEVGCDEAIESEPIDVETVEEMSDENPEVIVEADSDDM